MVTIGFLMEYYLKTCLTSEWSALYSTLSLYRKFIKPSLINMNAAFHVSMNCFLELL